MNTQLLSDTELDAMLRPIIRLHGQIKRGHEQGIRNRENGHLARLADKTLRSARAAEIQEKGRRASRDRGIGIYALTPEERTANGIKGGSISGQKSVESGQLFAIRTFETCSAGGLRGTHNRWHTGKTLSMTPKNLRRRKLRKSCKFCQSEGL
jgi:hypothetical protein